MICGEGITSPSPRRTDHRAKTISRRLYGCIQGKIKSTFYWLCPMINSCRRAISLYHAVIAIDYCLCRNAWTPSPLLQFYTHTRSAEQSLTPRGIIAAREGKKSPSGHWEGNMRNSPNAWGREQRPAKVLCAGTWENVPEDREWEQKAMLNFKPPWRVGWGAGGIYVVEGRTKQVYFLCAGGGLSCTVNSGRMSKSHGSFDQKQLFTGLDFFLYTISQTCFRLLLELWKVFGNRADIDMCFVTQLIKPIRAIYNTVGPL